MWRSESGELRAGRPRDLWPRYQRILKMRTFRHRQPPGTSGAHRHRAVPVRKYISLIQDDREDVRPLDSRFGARSHLHRAAVFVPRGGTRRRRPRACRHLLPTRRPDDWAETEAAAAPPTGLPERCALENLNRCSWRLAGRYQWL